MARILTLCSAFPPVAGGAETYADVVTAGLADRGHDVLVLTDVVPGSPSVEKNGRRRVRRLSAYLSLLEDASKLRWEQLYFGLLPEVAAAVHGWCPDVVLVNNLETTVIGRIVADETGAALVGSYHEHDPDSEDLGRGKMALAYRWLAPDAVLAGSAYYAQRALRYVPPERVHLIYHGVDTGTFRPAIYDGGPVRSRYGVGPGATLVVNVGRLKQRKGQLELIRAVAALRDPRVHLVIAGGISSASAAYAGELADAVGEAGLTGRVTIDQNVTHAEVPALLAAADIVAQPSRSEGLGLALLEGMSAGRPAVATRIAGFDEILRAGHTDPGDLVELADPGDVGTLATALGRLVGDGPRCSALAAAARRHVERYFSRDVMLTRTEAVVLAAARGPATGAAGGPGRQAEARM